MLLEGEVYVEFRADGRRNVDFHRLTRFLAMQEDILVQFLELEFRPSSARSRRQAINFMLEFCALLSEGFVGSDGEKNRKRFRRIARLVQRARRVVRKGR